MSKQLSKEDMRAYRKARRDRLKGVKPIVNPSPDIVNPVCKAPDDVKPCGDCKALELENKKLRAQIDLLKLEIEKRVHAAVVSDPLPRLKPLGSNYKPNSLYGA